MTEMPSPGTQESEVMTPYVEDAVSKIGSEGIGGKIEKGLRSRTSTAALGPIGVDITACLPTFALSKGRIEEGLCPPAQTPTPPAQE